MNDADVAEISTAEALWTIPDLAAFLSVPVGTVRTWRKRRTGPRSYKVGHSVRYQRADVMAWLEAQGDEAA